MEDNVKVINDKSMRKSQKEQIKNILELLDQAHAAIKKALETKNTEIALTLLEQAQDLAIQVGGMIEESLGEDFVTVGMLESYCEQIFQTYEMIRQQQPLNSNKACKNLNKELIRIENSVKNDISVRTTAVFLPYKASMWDSLESVWRAADADPNCDAYVIPIPYFDKNPDGSFKEEHYEGDQYPKDVPITRYDEFDLEACRPDVIYIHNPYDECNHVTSVHPFFYSKNLINFTDKLVYIPYFVLKEIEPDNQEAIDRMKHFCFTPGTIYAHKVIVQSEKMRQIYINEYIKAAKEMGLPGEHVDRRFLEKKFLGTGSPKIDKVLSTKKENLEIPPEWLKIIEKPDGSWKKIVFYNTSVSALLKQNEKMLRKMESVFEIFKEKQDEVALLWRPHPLIQATIESMRPQLWEEYRKIRERYIEENWGIYDDTADLNRAIVLSDAYYGDPSSVVELCLKAELSVMIQNVDVIEQPFRGNSTGNNGEVLLEDAVWNKDKIWFCTSYFNSLFCVDRINGKIDFLGEFPNENYRSIRLYTSMKLIKEKIYFIPSAAKAIAVYDIKKQEFRNILLDEKRLGGSLEKDFLFMGVEEYKNYLFILPAQCKAIIRLNVDNWKVDYITDWYEKVEQDVFNKADSFFRRQVIIKADKLYVPFCNANAILELDCNSLNSTIHKLGEEEIGYSGVCCNGKDFYLSPRGDGDLYKWNPESNSVVKIKIYKENTVKNPYAYAGLLNVEDEIILFPTNCEERSLDENSGNILIKNGAFSFAKEENGFVAFYEINQGLLNIKDIANQQSVMVTITYDQIQADIKKLLDLQKNRIREIPEATIRSMIKAII